MKQSRITGKGFKRLKFFNRTALAAIAALALGLWTPQMASATAIFASEPNDTGATAQNVNGFFSNESDVNITDSGPAGLPHVSITRDSAHLGSGYDFYRFTSLGGTIILDIDGTPTGGIGTDHDTEIAIWNSAGIQLAENDDFPVDPGSVANPGNGCLSGGSCNSFIQLLGQLPGDYIVAVCRFDCAFSNGFGISGNAITTDGFYTLHISTPHDTGTVPTPEPSAMILLGSGLAGLGAYRRGRNAKKN